MDTIELGNDESLVYDVFLNQNGTFIVMVYTKNKMLKTENSTHHWLERNSSE